MRRVVLSSLSLFIGGTLVCGTASAQDRLSLLPGYSDFQSFGKAMESIQSKAQSVNPRWVNGMLVFPTGFNKEGSILDPKTLKWSQSIPATQPGTVAPAVAGGQRGNPERGRQFDTVISPDGQWTAKYVAPTIVLTEKDAKEGKKLFAKHLSEAGNRQIKFGTGSWVYGEELGQREAMWFSPDSKKLATYRFDETDTPLYYLTLGQNKIQNSLYTEAYPKAGAPNPTVELYVYDIASEAVTQVDVKFGDAQLGEYVYAISWSPDGKELLFHRTNRKQNTLELVATNPNNGQCRVVVHEESPNGWTENTPDIRWISDSQFIWSTEKNGFKNFDLYDIKKGLVRSITKNTFEAGSVVRIDSASNTIWYTARSGSNPYHMQLHRIKMDGSGEKRLTDGLSNHTTSLSADGKYFVDSFQSFDRPASVQLCDGEGKVLKVLSEANKNPFEGTEYTASERFACPAADGKTTIYGYLSKPVRFDASKKYPMIVEVYGGPESGTGSERFRTPNRTNALGFVSVWIDGRGTSGRGRDFRQSVYRNLGITEIDDQAAAVKWLAANKPYVDGTRVGINGTSYGGYASLMCLVRYPDVFAAASCSSSVTAWNHYDSIYTERYMDTPQNNPEGYQKGSAMTYAKNLKGRLLLFYGTADDNVHPANTHQMIAALGKESKSYELAVGVDQGHAGVNYARMMEFFIDSLIVNPPSVWKRAGL